MVRRSICSDLDSTAFWWPKSTKINCENLQKCFVWGSPQLLWRRRWKVKTRSSDVFTATNIHPTLYSSFFGKKWTQTLEKLRPFSIRRSVFAKTHVLNLNKAACVFWFFSLRKSSGLIRLFTFDILVTCKKLTVTW